MPNNKITIIETEDHLDIIYSWYNPGAWVLLLMSFVLFGIAASFLIGGLGEPGEIFPLLFTGIFGTVLFFMASSLLLNKTYLNLDQTLLSVRTKPFGLFSNARNIPVDQILQLYVKEKVTKSEGNEHKSYQLLAKTKGSYDKTIMSMSTLESQDALAIEQRLEQFLGIRDEPVKGEYGSMKASSVPKFSSSPKSRLIDFRQMPWLNYRVGQPVSYQGKTYKVVYKIQHDWLNGESDQQLQLVAGEQEKLLFIKQNKGLFQTFIEQEIPLSVASKIHFNKTKPSNTLTLDDITYHLFEIKEGSTINSNTDKSIPSKQWIYQSKDQQQIRILDQQERLSYYQGHKINPTHLKASSSDDFLDLNAPNKEYRIDYDEEDFV